MMQNYRLTGLFVGVLVVSTFFGSRYVSAVVSDQKVALSAAEMQSLQELQLVGLDQKAVAVAVQKNWTVFCFLGCECPLAKLYAGRFQQLSEDFEAEKFAFVAINSNLQDSLADIQKYVAEHHLRVPLLKDYDHRLADLLNAERTPEVIILSRDGNIVYRGRIDDQYQPGTVKSVATEHYLADALRQLAAGQAVRIPQTAAVGCLISKVYAGEITTGLTYTRDISPLLNRHCVECHRPGEIGPFSLMDYEEVVGWGETLLEVIEQGRMPPWHANPAHGQFANARQMPAADKIALKNWVTGGMPYGKPQEWAAPPAGVSGWQLPREPDLIVPMSVRPFQVASAGVIEYQYFVCDPKFDTDRWVIGAQVQPGNRAVVHHAIVFVRPPDGTNMRGLGWVSAYVPGQRSTLLPVGMGRKIPAGSQLVFQMHYTPTGKAESDLSQIGLLFGEADSIQHEVFTLPAINSNFEIPPHAEKYTVTGNTNRIPQNGQLLALAPHMHVRGKSFRTSAITIDQQKSTILLDVPRYDFNWQHVYELQQPLPLAGIEKFEFQVVFDNSANNPFNPAPAEYVTWGDQTWEEMAIAFYEIAVPVHENIAYLPGVQNEKTDSKPQADLTAEQEFVDQFFDRFDENKDRIIVRDEMPLSQQRYGFRRLDHNKDDRLQPEEIAQEFRSRAR